MTTEQLDTLPTNVPLYIPTDWDVAVWILAGRVPGRDYYTLLHPPDSEGVVSRQRPVYLHALDLLPATLDEPAAWKVVLEGLQKRIDWIQTNKKSPAT